MDYDFQELSIKIFILLIIYYIVDKYPNLKKYSDETRFNMYRSVMCFAFTCMGLHIVINHFFNGIAHPFSFKHRDMDEIQYVFMAYLIIDLLKLIASKSNRWDLYAHHIVVIISILLGLSIGKYGYLFTCVLICESISIVTGPDAMAMEDNNKYESYIYKLYRKRIINYIRMPMWILLFMFTFKYTNKCPPELWYTGMIFPVILLLLDTYWSDKCDKVIKKYENKN